jgi:4-amino-4-deoxy-L-arabinose transferase-like glycosyltransferase
MSTLLMLAGVVAAFRLWSNDRPLAWVAIAVVIVGVWAGGIMANFGPNELPPKPAIALRLVAMAAAAAMLVISFLV